MKFYYLEESGFVIIEIIGEITITNILELKREFQTVLAGTENYALNLKNIKKIDSSGIGLFVNLYKKMEKDKRVLAIFELSPFLKNIFEEVNLNKVLKIYDNYNDFRIDCIQEVRDIIYPPENYDFENKLYKKYILKCPVCNTSGNTGFILNKETQDLKFMKEHLNPIYEGKEGNHTINVRGMQLCSCYSCGFSTRHIGYFSDETGDIKTTLSEKNILQLNKDDKKRAEIMRKFTMNSPDKFNPPHEKIILLSNYMLAEETTHTLYNTGDRLAMSDLGYYNAQLSEIPGNDKKKIYEENSFMWYTEVINKRYQFSHDTIAEAFYYLIILCCRLDKFREAEEIARKLEEEQFTAESSIAYKQVALSFMEDRAS